MKVTVIHDIIAVKPINQTGHPQAKGRHPRLIRDIYPSSELISTEDIL